MKNIIANRKLAGLSAIVLAVAVGATVPTSQALGQRARVVANIPFDFQNGSEHLPAGKYTIDMTADHVMRLNNGKINSASLSREEIDHQPSTCSKLVFTRYGSSRYFLREVWMADKAEHQVLAKSKAEKRQLNAMNVADRNGIEVALLEPFK